MSELPVNKTDEISSFNFFKSAADTDIRDVLYRDCAVPSVDFYEACLSSLDLQGQECLLESGCGSGRFIVRVIEQGHKGEVVGLDVSESIYEPARFALSDYHNVQFVEADMRQMPFEDNSFDAVCANYSLYHVAENYRALKEIKRVLKPGGRFNALTRGDFNLARQWELAGVVTSNLGLARPITQYTNFDAEEAASILAEDFTVVPDLSLPADTNASLIRRMELGYNNWYEYSYSIYGIIRGDLPTYIDLHSRTDNVLSAVRKEIKRVVKPIFDEEIQANGYFLEIAQDKLVACVNDKK